MSEYVVEQMMLNDLERLRKRIYHEANTGKPVLINPNKEAVVMVLTLDEIDTINILVDEAIEKVETYNV